MTRALIAATVITLALTGCSNGETDPPATNAQATATTSTAAKTTSAADIAGKFKAANLPVIGYAEQDEKTDPNDKLGRPNGYTARASFDVTGGDPRAEKYVIERGAVIEIWPNAADAQQRSEYIQSTLKAAPILGTEYHYVTGGALVRISGKVLPSLAKKYEQALQAA